ncbi:MAG: hypothetical protein JWN65_3046 [Solirubrobacterales bacterium]|nr:hypothetical protein [Solirubrobacterales bacterium]
MTPRHGRISSRRSVVLPVAAVLGVLQNAPATLAADDRTAATASVPVVTGFTFRPATLRPGAKGAFRFTTSREGAGTIVLARLRGGGRTVPAGRLRFAVDAGEGRRSFDGRVAGRRLKAGRYRATVTVTNASTGTSAPRRLTFRIA